MVTREKTQKEVIVAIIERYERRLSEAGIPKTKMNPNRTFGSLNMLELLAHAHYLCDEVKELAGNSGKQRKLGSHLAAVQMCLSFADWYTLQELREHNVQLKN